MKYVAIDAGKYMTKAAVWEEEGYIRLYSFPTAFCKGDFRDDALEQDTILVRLGKAGEKCVCKVGAGAMLRGSKTKQETTKMSDHHKVCALSMLAWIAKEEGTDQFAVATGMTPLEWDNVEKREAFKHFLLPVGLHHVAIKESAAGVVKEKNFEIVKAFCYPEGIGGVLGDFPEESGIQISKESMVGIIDLGGANNSNSCYKGVTLVPSKTATGEYGGAKLLKGLSQKLTVQFSRCDDDMLLSVLMDKEHRYLRSKTNPEAVKEQSKELIDEYLFSYAEQIKGACDACDWSIDFMDIIVIGKTTMLLEDELKAVFGNRIYVVPNARYCNVLGYLRLLCAREDTMAVQIPLVDKEGQNLFLKEM